MSKHAALPSVPQSQWDSLSQLALAQEVPGSNPGAPTNQLNSLLTAPFSDIPIWLPVLAHSSANTRGFSNGRGGQRCRN
jgi:hypothetical protein